MRTLNDTLAGLKVKENFSPLPAPPYYKPHKSESALCRVALAVHSMKDHTSDEGWQIMSGLQRQGWLLAGHGIEPFPQRTSVPEIVRELRPDVVFVQDKREWDLPTGRRDFRDERAYFSNVECLQDHKYVFKLTLIKDAHQRPEYHRDSASEIGCHAWVTYYHPKIVTHLAPYVRGYHLIRTYHTINPSLVPEYSVTKREGCLLSGAVSGAYPLRQTLINGRHFLPQTTHLSHPGYRRDGCLTPEFLKTLSKFKVAVCTSSMYGYALRKIIEATACGCAVLTDLPTDEVLPHIDGNLYRIDPKLGARTVGRIIRKLLDQYNPEVQKMYAERALRYYNYAHVTKTLHEDIEIMRSGY